MTPADPSSTDPVSVKWAVSISKDLSSPFSKGSLKTSADRDYTVKVGGGCCTVSQQDRRSKGRSALATQWASRQLGAHAGWSTASPLQVIPSYLQSGVKYYFGFTAGSVGSPVGTFKLPPAAGKPLDSLKYAIVSCSNWGWGYFNACASPHCARPK